MLPASPELPSSNSKGEKEGEGEEKEVVSKRERVRMEKRLTQEEEKVIPMEEAGNLPPALKPMLRDLKFATKFYIS